MEESKQQITEEIDDELFERMQREKREEVAAEMKAAALADLMAEAQTATTGQIKTVCSFLRKLQEMRGGRNNG